MFFLKPDSVGNIPRCLYRLGDRQSVKALQFFAYIERTRNNVSHAGNLKEVRLAWVINMKDLGFSAQTNEFFRYIGCFRIWYLCMPNRQKPIGKSKETLQKRYGTLNEVTENRKRCVDMGLGV